MRRGRRPTLSRKRTAGRVTACQGDSFVVGRFDLQTVFTIPYTPVASREVVFGSRPRLAKTAGISGFLHYHHGEYRDLLVGA
jgi:hypothetical protein